MGDEVKCAFLVGVFYAKVVDNKTEGDRLGAVLEEFWCVTGVDVSTGGEVSGNFVVHNAACLW